MIIGSLKEVFLSSSRDTFLFDLQLSGMDPEARSAYREVLNSLIRFTGDIRVRQLTPDHINLYITNLFDGPTEGAEHDELVMSQYSMIQTWIQWMYVQKFIVERDGATVKPPAPTSLIPSRITWSLAHYWKYPLSV